MAGENYLALDIGEKRIGVAVGSVVPFGRGALDATDTAHVIEAVRDLIKAESITGLLVGIPRVKSGDITSSQHNALAWAKRLEAAFGLPVELVDESYTSQEAETQLRAQKVDITHEKWRIDERSAEIILGQYLNERA